MPTDAFQVFFSGKYLRVEKSERGVFKIILSRPEVKNALNAEMICELSAQLSALADIKNENEFRLLVLLGDGPVFCAGADLKYMRAQSALSEQRSLEDAKNLAELFFKLANQPVPVLSFVQGAAIGGGLGLAMCSDFVLATEDSLFATTEVRLGIVPGVISPYIVRRIGLAHCSDFMLSGTRLNAQLASQKGIVNRVVSSADFEKACTEVVEHFLNAGPCAARRTKELLLKIAPLPDRNLFDFTASSIARARCSPEGQAGLAAFFEKKPAPWLK